ncbi:MAG TPA: TrkA C-terminal domain-containing protein [Limnochordia bacterium]|nr:TrkA C-terminal domain-containing protein [Limnochordia bacterium]
MRKKLAIVFISAMRAIVVGVAYFLVRDLPGLTSSFVSIFSGFLSFDLIVAMPKFSIRLRHLKDLFVVLLPRMSATALSLAGGLVVGVLFGGLTRLGLPVLAGAVLTVGVSYSFASQVKGSISSYVGLVSAVEMFDRIGRISSFTDEWLQDLAGVAGQLVYGTFLALLMGWLVGIMIGIATRLFLPRGYRTVKSPAYAQPLWMRSFKDVTHFGEDKVLLQIELSEDSPLVYHTLAEVGLGRDLGVQVISIIRSPQEIISPRGSDVLLPLDQLVVVAPSAQAQNLISLMKGRVLSE